MNEITLTTKVVTVGGTQGFACKRELELLGLTKGDWVRLTIRRLGDEGIEDEDCKDD